VAGARHVWATPVARWTRFVRFRRGRRRPTCDSPRHR
jgi:hypothetical protein